jgi:hypothetical protein
MAVPSVEFIRVSSSSSAAARDTERACGQTRSRVRGEKRLRAKDIAALPPGVHEDGGGPRLVVEPPRGKQPGAGAGSCASLSPVSATTAAWVPGAPGPGPRCRRRYPPSRTRGPRPDYRAPWRANAVGDVPQGPRDHVRDPAPVTTAPFPLRLLMFFSRIRPCDIDGSGRDVANAIKQHRRR